MFFWEFQWFSVFSVLRLIGLSHCQTLKCSMKQYNTRTIFMFLGPVLVCFGLSSDLLQAMTATTAGNTLNRDNRNKLNPQQWQRVNLHTAWILKLKQLMKFSCRSVYFFVFTLQLFLLENVKPSAVKRHYNAAGGSMTWKQKWEDTMGRSLVAWTPIFGLSEKWCQKPKTECCALLNFQERR